MVTGDSSPNRAQSSPSALTPVVIAMSTIFAPVRGIEPLTDKLTAYCSANWATRDCVVGQPYVHYGVSDCLFSLTKYDLIEVTKPLTGTVRKSYFARLATTLAKFREMGKPFIRGNRSAVPTIWLVCRYSGFLTCRSRRIYCLSVLFKMELRLNDPSLHPISSSI